MTEPLQRAKLLAAYRKLLMPLVRILLRQGISFGEFSEIGKQVFVKIGSEKEFASRTHRPSGSQIAIITGLTRKEVKRLKELPLEAVEVQGTSQNRAARVLNGWHQDPDFTGPYGIPLELKMEDSANPDFTDLVKRYSGDMPARAMLEELKRVNAVIETDEGTFAVQSKYYITPQIDTEATQYLGDVIHDIASTIEHNFNPNRQGERRFERWVSNPHVPVSDMKDFRNLVKAKGQECLETLDNWLTGHEAHSSTSSDKTVRTRVGVYFYEGD